MSVLICDTTKEQREKIVKDAIAMSTLDAKHPSEYAMTLFQKYIEGQIELEDIDSIIIEHYKE